MTNEIAVGKKSLDGDEGNKKKTYPNKLINPKPSSKNPMMLLPMITRKSPPKKQINPLIFVCFEVIYFTYGKPEIRSSLFFQNPIT